MVGANFVANADNARDDVLKDKDDVVTSVKVLCLVLLQSYFDLIPLFALVPKLLHIDVGIHHLLL
jgi:hypothetical protein